MWKEVEHVILAPEKVIDEIVDVFLSFFSFSQEVFHLRRKEKTNKRHDDSSGAYPEILEPVIGESLCHRLTLE